MFGTLQSRVFLEGCECAALWMATGEEAAGGGGAAALPAGVAGLLGHARAGGAQQGRLLAPARVA